MAEYGEIVGVTETYERAAEISAARLAAARRQVEHKRKELETINQVRKAAGKRLLTLEEYMAIGAPTAPKAPALDTFFAKPKNIKKRLAPFKYSEEYENSVKSFLKSIDTDSEVDIIAKSKRIHFHHFSLSEFKALVNKASARYLNYFLRDLKTQLKHEVDIFEMEPEMAEKIMPFQSYVEAQIKSVAIAEKERDEKAAAAAAAAALRAEAEAAAAAARAEAEAAERKAAAEAAANIEKRKADDPYRKAIMEFIGAQEKLGRGGQVNAKKRAMNLRGALDKYNKNGSHVNDKLLSRKMKNDLVAKGLMKKGGKRPNYTRKNK